MSKEEMIEPILGAEVTETGANELSAKDEGKIDNQDVEVEAKEEKESASVEKTRDSQKMQYVEQIEIGTIVAFRLASGKVKSAKVVKKSTKNRKLKLETEYGAVYIASFDDVIWVRTGKRWPRGVYNLLKGWSDDDSDK